jgi:hypothetical protein
MRSQSAARRPIPAGVAPGILREPRSARTIFWGLQSRGLTPTEAGALTAHVHGLRTSTGGWTLREVEHLVFLRLLVERGEVPS